MEQNKTKVIKIPKFMILIFPTSILIFIYLISYDLTPQIHWFFEPTSSYWLNNSDQKSRFILSSLPFVTLLFFLIYATSTIVIGIAFFNSANSSVLRYYEKYNFIIPFLLMCYPIGSIIMIAINRLLTLFFDNTTASIFIFFLNSCMLLIFLKPKKKLINLKTKIDKKFSLTIIINVFSIIFLILFTVILLHFPDQHILGDGAKFTFDIIDDEINVNPNRKFPLIAKHYDELLFLYPLIMLIKFYNFSQNSLLFVFWIHYSLIKTGCFFLLITSGKYIGLSIKQSILLALLCFFANPYINPFRLRLIFDSGQPIAYSLHPGRVIVDVFTIYFTSLFLRKTTFIKIKSYSVFVFALFSTGLASLSISASLVFFGIISSIFSNIVQFQKEQILLIIGCLIYGFLLSSLLLGHGNESYSLIPLLCSLIICAILCIYFFTIQVSDNKSDIKNTVVFKYIFYFAVIICFYLVSLNTLGNILVIDSTWIDNIGQRIIGSNIDVKKYGFGVGNFCGQFPFSCSSPKFYIESYGYPFFLSSVTAIFISHKSQSFLELKYISNSLLHLFFLCSSLFLFTFINNGAQEWLDIWVKSRIPEPFFYSSIFFSFATLYKLTGIYKFPLFKTYSVYYISSILNLYTVAILFISIISQSYWNVLKANFGYLFKIHRALF